MVDVAIGVAWFERLERALTSQHAQDLVDCLAPDAWFRDILICSQAITSRQGSDAILGYLSEKPLPKITTVSLCQSHFDAPTEIHFGPAIHAVSVQFNFETDRMKAKGVAMVLPPQEGEQHGKAISLALILEDWKGLEEPYGQWDGTDHQANGWAGYQEARRKRTEEDPEILIGESSCLPDTMATRN
jgi:hypothetical protein